MAAMEAEHGSLTRALLAKMRAAKKSGSKSGGPAGPSGTLTTFEGGMTRLPEQLAAGCGQRLLLEHPVDRIESTAGGYRLLTDRGEIEADAVLLSVAASDAAKLVAPLSSDAVAPLSGIPTAPIAVVMLAYNEQEAFGQPVRGFGFLVPGGEESILGTLYCHDIFPGQAPPGTLLLRVMVGGTRSPEAVALSDDELLLTVRESLARVLGRNPEPDHRWIVRWQRGISQYTVGHLDRVADAEIAAGAAGVELAGSSYRGVSVNDCIKQARSAAARLAERIR
jgi:oxygen-dependent protoporphyrinogen oxidase